VSGECLAETDALTGGLADVGVVQQSVDRRGGYLYPWVLRRLDDVGRAVVDECL